MKTLFIIGIIFCSLQVYSQMPISDQAIKHQQERMVYKQWDKDKFTPSTKFLGVQINPLWYAIWGFNQNYMKTDHRPLNASGPQTMRLGLTTALKTTSNNYKIQSDTMILTASKELAVNSNFYEPLWELYYSKELKKVVNSTPESFLEGLNPETKKFLIDSKLWENHVIKMGELKERLTYCRSSIIDRGNRILYYHKLMLKYRDINAHWLGLRNHVPKRITSQKRIESSKQDLSNTDWTPKTDKEIAEKVVQDFKYLD